MNAVYTKTRGGEAITLERVSVTGIVADGHLVTLHRREVDDMVLCVNGTAQRIRYMDYLRTLALPLNDE
jgi:hypothetical protein